MKSIVVPIDFSPTSNNAARYAAALAREIPDAKLIFYHVFSPVAAGSDGTPLGIDNASRMEVAELALESVRNDVGGDVNVEFIAQEGTSLTDSLEKLVKHHGIDLVVMGLTGATRLDQLFMGSNALSMANRSVCPVLIVPQDATFTGVKNILFATDMKNVEQSTPVHQLRSLLSLFRAKLHVVNVNAEHYIELTEENQREKAALERILDGFEPDFAFVRLFDFIDAIETLVNDRNIDLIITVPRKHSFLSSLFKPSHTQKLAYHTHVPLVAIHE
ncbi:universal stress protein [Flavihumibacter rivuli]|uniref:universal stress protein n=1 Tax=Flavihumibacter rivuli TaxID=2838156 RepID=UPI001BDEF5EB|nr:universal stress protein [Flavihumibacter rivuli]ULQ57414.1 universal stress protein [Flavihumibacter rivuli]